MKHQRVNGLSLLFLLVATGCGTNHELTNLRQAPPAAGVESKRKAPMFVKSNLLELQRAEIVNRDTGQWNLQLHCPQTHAEMCNDESKLLSSIKVQYATQSLQADGTTLKSRLYLGEVLSARTQQKPLSSATIIWLNVAMQTYVTELAIDMVDPEDECLACDSESEGDSVLITAVVETEVSVSESFQNQDFLDQNVFKDEAMQNCQTGNVTYGDLVADQAYGIGACTRAVASVSSFSIDPIGSKTGPVFSIQGVLVK